MSLRGQFYVDDALKDAVEKTKDLGVVEPKSGEAKQQRTQQFAGAFEKGSVDAYNLEKKQAGNKTERDQLKVQREIRDNTAKPAVTYTETQIPN